MIGPIDALTAFAKIVVSTNMTRMQLDLNLINIDEICTTLAFCRTLRFPGKEKST